MLRSSSLLLLAAVVELIGAGPLPNGSPFALLARFSNQTSSITTQSQISSAGSAGLSVVPLQSELLTSSSTFATSVCTASKSNAMINTTKTISQSLEVALTSPTEPTNAAATNSSNASVGTDATPSVAAGSLAAITGSSQTGNNSDTFPLASSTSSSNAFTILSSTAANSGTVFPLIGNSTETATSTATTASLVTTTSSELDSATSISNAAASSSLDGVQSTVTEPPRPGEHTTAAATQASGAQPSDPTNSNSIVIITATHSHSHRRSRSHPAASSASVALTLPSILTVDPASASTTITIPAPDTTAQSGGLLSVVPVGKTSTSVAGNGNGGPTATVTVTVGLMTVTTTMYLVVETTAGG